MISHKLGPEVGEMEHIFVTLFLRDLPHFQIIEILVHLETRFWIFFFSGEAVNKNIGDLVVVMCRKADCSGSALAVGIVGRFFCRSRIEQEFSDRESSVGMEQQSQ